MSGQQGTSQDQMVDPGIDYSLSTHNVADTLRNLKECSLLYDLIEAAGLLNELRHSGLRTLLAPRNDALAGHTPSDPEAFLNHHTDGWHEGFGPPPLRYCAHHRRRYIAV